MENPVIGKGTTFKPTPNALDSLKPPLGYNTVLAPTVPPSLSTAINDAAKNTQLNLKPIKPESVGTADFVTGLTKPQVMQIIPWLDKFGASKTDISTVDNAKKFLENNFSTYVEQSKGSLTKLIQLFKNDYIPTSDTSTTAGPQSNGVTQYVTKQSQALLTQSVDKFLLENIGSTNIKPESRKAIMDEINKMIDAGTTTTTTRDKSGKTTITQAPGYSEERAGAVVERVAKELEPEKYGQQKELSFFDFMQRAEQMRGGR
jgi:hypothetical protein